MADHALVDEVVGLVGVIGGARLPQEVAAMGRRASGGEGAVVKEAPAEAQVDLGGVAPIGEFRLVARSLIWVDSDYDRRKVDRAKLEELAASIRSVGIRQPIALAEQPGPGGEPFRLVFGLRRLRAAGMVGLETVPAMVAPYPGGQAQIHAVRAIENRDRQDLTPIEDVLGVCAVIDMMMPRARAKTGIPAPASPQEADVRAEGEVRRVAIAMTAEVLGKTIEWVRDRSYVARLSPGGKARKLVESGRLSLGHARIIARLGDPALQDMYAEYAAYAEDGTGGWSLQKLADRVAGERLSLKVVPWMLDTPFAGMPACTNCPHNTANDVGLFGPEAGPDGVGGGVGTCTNRACFERKRSMTERTIETRIRAVEKAAKQDPDLRLTEKALGESGLIPQHVKPATFVRRAQQEVGPREGGKGAPEADAGEAPTPREVAQRMLSVADREWGGSIDEEFWRAARAAPGRVAALMVLLDTPIARKAGAFGFGDESKQQRTVRQSPKFVSLLAVLKNPTIEGIHAIEKELGSSVEYDLEDCTLELRWAMANAMGAEIPPRPTLEDFLGSKPRPGFCRVCGCSEGDPCDEGCGWADKSQTLCTACVAKGWADGEASPTPAAAPAAGGKKKKSPAKRAGKKKKSPGRRRRDHADPQT